jgi:hypothetical protein
MHRVRAALFVVGLALASSVATQAPAPVHLSVDGRVSANAWVAAAGARVAVAWGARQPGGGTDVYVAVSADGARTFARPVRVTDRPGTARINGENAPRVTFAPRAGRPPAIDVLWASTEGPATTIRLARSTDEGKTFGASHELQSSKASGNRGWATLATDRRGGVHALWLDHRGLAAERRSAEAHHHQHDTTTTTATTTTTTTDGAAMAQKSGLYYSNGSSEQELVKGVCYCCKTALAAGPDGTLFAAWRHVYPGNVRDIAFTTSRDGGRTFAPAARVSDDRWQLNGCPEDGPALAIDAAGTAHIAWPTVTTQPEPHKALFYSTTSDGKRFATRMRVSPMRRNIAHPQLALGPGGEVAVFWDEIVNGRRRVFLSRKDAASGFGAAEALSDGTSASYAVPVFADGAFVVAWTEGTGDNSRVVVRRVPTR